MTSPSQKYLNLKFHGRILDHLGIQMYQSPVASLAELISNSWDADAENVKIYLPNNLDKHAEIKIFDDGTGMSFEECQYNYLNVGWCRRELKNGDLSKEKQRPILGRKGIGKFAGFGIAETIEIETFSKSTGERTKFSLNINELKTQDYIETNGFSIPVEIYEKDSDSKTHGTTITLKNLILSRTPSPKVYLRSMARRFLLHQRVDDFTVFINDKLLPNQLDLEGVEYVFPRDYSDDEKPQGLQIDQEWGTETLSNGKTIKWRFVFYEETIDEEELRGIAVFSRGKLAQKPFFFNLTGGLGGQHGQEYLSGQVEADYVDELDNDVIAPERQRINWENKDTQDLLEWGREKVKELLRIWHNRRGEQRRKEIEEKLAHFSDRLSKLSKAEQRTIKGALTKLGSISTLSKSQFESLGEAVLKAWEQGRLRDLIDTISEAQDITSDWLLSVLVEADTLVALNLAETIKAKLEAVKVLKSLVDKGELENKIRDHIAERPYLLNPKWETFRKEISVKKILNEAAKEAGLDEDDEHPEYEGQKKRLDLALRSHEHLLVVEFMRPGKKADYDHLTRCMRYVILIRDKIKPQTQIGIRKISGLIVADYLEKDPSVRGFIQNLEKDDIWAFSWGALINEAEETWREFLEIVGDRAPDDDRIKKLIN